MMKLIFSYFLAFFLVIGVQAQKINDATTPLHLMKPAYDTPYGKPDEKQITVVLDKVFNYLNQVTPAALINKET